MRYLFLYLITLVPLFSKAQTYTGLVTDNSGDPLVSASIVAKTGDGSVVAFARAGQDGHFSLIIPQGKEAKEIEFMMIGYGKVTIPLKDYQNGQAIRMSEQAIAIKEVKVTPQRIREQGDTLTYSVAGFKQKQDRTIADVIAKMPGLEVLPTGTIRYQGKAINKFYIEGMDLLGGKYAMASENLSADQVKSVQVYENHQPIKALKDMQFSEQAAINLILKDDAKNMWQGVMEVATGYGDEWLRDGHTVNDRPKSFSDTSDEVPEEKTDNAKKHRDELCAQAELFIDGQKDHIVLIFCDHFRTSGQCQNVHDKKKHSDENGWPETHASNHTPL